MATIQERVQVIVAERLGVERDKVVPEASFVDDLNADSLDLVELIMAFEEEVSGEEIKIEIDDEEAEKIITVQDAITHLSDHGVKDE